MVNPPANGAPDPLVHTIAERIRDERSFVAHVHAEPYQNVVDLHWAGRQAGQLLGRAVRVTTSHVLTRDGWTV